ncbi:MAG: hypothetical protein NC253_03590 [Ruminococcus sp.]|nr:hypothetical protein [Ruminococcus sp.]MCM1381387.1 hypothetical protein [Muribaculaceae bacterium]MCM1479509.1 hypothetical protein [Muribaculaceae bacterium]
MSTKEYAVNVFNTLDDVQLLDFLKLFADDNTLALVESEIIANDPNRKHYDSFKDILKEIDEETA